MAKEKRTVLGSQAIIGLLHPLACLLYSLLREHNDLFFVSQGWRAVAGSAAVVVGIVFVAVHRVVDGVAFRRVGGQ